MARCTLCERSAVSGNAVSHAQNHTKRKFKPNLQKVNGLLLCTRCLKTIKTIQRNNAASAEIPAEVLALEEVKDAASIKDGAGVPASVENGMRGKGEQAETDSVSLG